MEIRHLKMIKEVARHGSLTKASEHLYLSQSALSHQLKEIEDFFKTQVFIRQKKQMLLTNTGKIILEASEKIIQELESTKNKIHYLTEKNAGEIRISTECHTAYHWLCTFLSEFSVTYPKVEVIINSEATYTSTSALLENKIDIGVLADNSNAKLNYTPLFRDEFLAIVPNGHKWTKLKWVNEADFAEENYIMYNIPNEISFIYKKLFQSTKPKKIYKIALTEAIIQMVKAGLGITVLPHWVVANYISSGEVSGVPVTRKGIKRTWYAAVLKNKEIPPYMNVFIRCLAKHLKNSEELSFFEVQCA